jgi:predicted ATPase with chaperone activity
MNRIAELSKQLAELRGELEAEALKLNPEPWAELRGQEHCKRAIIVAAVQGHTVCLIGCPGNGEELLQAGGALLGVPVVVAQPCPCGRFADPRLACRCTPTKISNWTRDKLLPLARLAQIHVECPPVPARDMLTKCFGSSVADARAQLDRKGPLPSLALDEAGATIVRQATSELGLSKSAVDVCLDVARSIASLGGSTNLRAEDVCEAIHYRRLDRLTL